MRDVRFLALLCFQILPKFLPHSSGVMLMGMYCGTKDVGAVKHLL